ncbi:efflux RND transporter periplasmic adaptor subunit [Nitrobacter vulgaris]|uniref:HlyD family secretion protein n=1 Tax=Nitrobacter vulgaris TaxID=29421 RepID=A0A1V4HZ83_NITVU|nr:HlyD family efflux transporter periplasmic adaptor subunit [Nitrobacter vulgaris]OPH82882.1 HlyD family secretion protein [Nitrobacter vulgaris]
MFLNQCCPRGQFARLGAIGFGCLFALVLSISVSIAHEGHDHGEDQKSAAASAVFPRVTAQSERYEVVGILKNGSFLIFIDDAVSNQPVTDVNLQVTIGDFEAVEAKRGPNGYTIPFPDLGHSGSTEVIFAISGGKGDDLLVDSFMPSQPIQPNTRHNSTRISPMGTLAVLLLAGSIIGILFGYLRRRGRRNAASIAGLTSGACLFLAAVASAGWQNAGMSPSTPQLQAQSDAPRRLPDGTAFAAKPTQRLLDIRTATAEPGSARPAFNLIGRIIGDPNRSSIVQSLYGGRIVPNEATLPRIGQKVSKGEILLRIEPYLPVADRTTISEKMGEIGQLIAVAETKINRLRPLAERGAAPMGQLHDLESELAGLRARRETMRNSRGGFELLRALTDGIITAAKAVPGQVVQPQDVLFEIADPQGLWVEALAYDELDPAGPVQATASDSDGTSFLLSYLGTSRALRQHASVVHFSVPQPPLSLRIGQPVTVLVQGGRAKQGLIHPRDAVVQTNNGESVVWVHVAPERFEPKPVRIEPLDAKNIIVAAGLNASDRVVVRGADLINQIR